MEILVRKSPEEMLKGIGLDINQVQRVTLAIGKAVQQSFKERSEKLSESEVIRRTKYCFHEVLKFVGDFSFTVREVEYYLGTSLRMFLLGLEYQPSARLLKGRQQIID